MRWIAAVLLGLYTYVIGMLTLGGTSSVDWAFGVTDRYYAMTEGQANVALFVPAGFLLAIVLLNPVLAAATGLLGSLAIEYVQLEYLPDRVADVHDVLHNGLGALLGALVALPLVLLLRQRRRSRPRAQARPSFAGDQPEVRAGRA